MTSAIWPRFSTANFLFALTAQEVRASPNGEALGPWYRRRPQVGDCDAMAAEKPTSEPPGGPDDALPPGPASAA